MMSDLNIVICPGCAKRLPKRNKGCTFCGWEDNVAGRIQTMAEFLSPSGDETQCALYNDVSPAFLIALVKATGGRLPDTSESA